MIVTMNYDFTKKGIKVLSCLSQNGNKLINK